MSARTLILAGIAAAVILGAAIGLGLRGAAVAAAPLAIRRPDREANPTWYVSGTGQRSGARWTQVLYQATRTSNGVILNQVGTVSLDFSSATVVWFSWGLNGVPGGEHFVHAPSAQGRSGIWYIPTEPGWGILVQESSQTLNALVAFYSVNSPRWMRGGTTPSSNAMMPLVYHRGPGSARPAEGAPRPRRRGDWSMSSLDLQILDDRSSMGGASTLITQRNSVGIPMNVWTRLGQTIQILTTP